jgi:hypothetical protein
MYDLFISNKFQSQVNLFIEIFSLIAIASVLIWIINILIIKRKDVNDLSLNTRVNLNFLWSINILMVLFIIYIVTIYILNGAYSFHWNNLDFSITGTYLNMLPQITLFTFLIVMFIIGHSKILKNLKN